MRQLVLGKHSGGCEERSCAPSPAMSSAALTCTRLSAARRSPLRARGALYTLPERSAGHSGSRAPQCEESCRRSQPMRKKRALHARHGSEKRWKGAETGSHSRTGPCGRGKLYQDPLPHAASSSLQPARKPKKYPESHPISAVSSGAAARPSFAPFWNTSLRS